MKRRDFLKVSGAATAGLALTGCLPGRESKTAAATPLENEQKKLYKDRISRDVSPYDPLYLKEITVNIGLKEPFDVMHVSDSHIARADDRDGERTIKLAASRSRGMNAGEHYLDEAVNIARKKGMHLMHTGDLIDFVSEANLDTCAKHMMDEDWFTCSGNHEFSIYMGEDHEDEAYKRRSYDAVQGAFPNDITFASRVIGGVNFVAVDNVYYNFTHAQLELMKAEAEKGLPMVMLVHVPLYTPAHFKDEMEEVGGECAYLAGVPDHLVDTYKPGRQESQRADAPTMEFIDWLKEQSLLKAILAGHMHRFFEDRFSASAIQYTVGACYLGEAEVVHFV